MHLWGAYDALEFEASKGQPLNYGHLLGLGEAMRLAGEQIKPRNSPKSELLDPTRTFRLSRALAAKVPGVRLTLGEDRSLGR